MPMPTPSTTPKNSAVSAYSSLRSGNGTSGAGKKKDSESRPLGTDPLNTANQRALLMRAFFGKVAPGGILSSSENPAKGSGFPPRLEFLGRFCLACFFPARSGGRKLEYSTGNPRSLRASINAARTKAERLSPSRASSTNSINSSLSETARTVCPLLLCPDINGSRNDLLKRAIFFIETR